MKILLKREDFLTVQYDLCVGELALVFEGENDSFSVPYSQIMDFVITQGRYEKSYFTIMVEGEFYEGKISDSQDIEAFVGTLKRKLNGVINTEIKRI